MVANSLRNKIVEKNDRIMDFGVKEVRNTPSGKFINYHNGPIVEFDGNIIGTVFDILSQTHTHNPNRKRVAEYLSTRDVPKTEGIYVISNGERSSVICTSNVASSLAKVILDGYNATNQSDGFSKRIARASKIIFTLRSTVNNYYAGAKLAGMLDNLTPSNCLSETKGFYRNYPSYKKGLIEARNMNTLLIEECLDNGVKPEFMPNREVKFWRHNGYKIAKIMSSRDFIHKKSELYKKYSD